MPSAGAVCSPLIVPIRKYIYGQSTTHIDTSTLIEITCETPDVKIYFTADGTKPNPFQRKLGGKEVTFRYTEPFTLKDGKRTLKAIAVSRDGLKESDVVTKQYVVDDIGKINTSSDPYSSSDLDTSDFDAYDFTTDSTLKSSKSSKSSTSSKSSKEKSKKAKSPLRSSMKSPTRSLRTRSRSKSPKRKATIPKEAWASSGVTDTFSTGAFGEQAPPIPDGPFNPTNYSGTQINVWGGAPPPFVQGMPGGGVNLGQPGLCNPYTTQYGYLTENMLQGCNPDSKHVTVGDLRQYLKGRQQPAPAPAPTPQPTIEYQPTYKDPPLNPISPGGGMMSKSTRVTFSS